MTISSIYKSILLRDQHVKIQALLSYRRPWHKSALKKCDFAPNITNNHESEMVNYEKKLLILNAFQVICLIKLLYDIFLYRLSTFITNIGIK